MLDYGAWQRRYGGRPSIIGERITVDNEPVTIVGVMPPTVNLDFGILPDYFAIAGIPVKRGRPPVAVRGERQAAIDEVMAAKHWPGEDPVGQRFRLDKGASPTW